MNFTHIIKEIGRGCQGAGDLSTEDAYQLYSAILDGGVPELELGAILIALRMKTEAATELAGFYRAVTDRVYRLSAPAETPRPVVLPSYNGARHQANLLPLLALLLQRFDVPVLIHGTLEGHGRVASAYILRELGVLPSPTLATAEKNLREERLAFVPTAVLSPGLATLLSVRSRLGVRNSAHSLAKVIDPFEDGGLRVVGVSHPAYLEKMRDLLSNDSAPALLLRGTEGEPVANPKRRPQIELFSDGRAEVLFEAESGPIRALPHLPASREAAETAAWIRQVMAGEVPIPLPVVNQLACCLYGAGYTDDLSQAKAIVALETGSLVAV